MEIRLPPKRACGLDDSSSHALDDWASIGSPRCGHRGRGLRSPCPVAARWLTLVFLSWCCEGVAVAGRSHLTQDLSPDGAVAEPEPDGHEPREANRR